MQRSRPAAATDNDDDERTLQTGWETAAFIYPVAIMSSTAAAGAMEEDEEEEQQCCYSRHQWMADSQWQGRRKPGRQAGRRDHHANYELNAPLVIPNYSP